MTLRTVQEEVTAAKAFNSGRYPIAVGQAAADSLENWLQDAFATYRRGLQDAREPWTDAVGAEVSARLKKRAHDDANRLQALARQHLPERHDTSDADLWASRDDQISILEAEIALLVESSNRRTHPLNVKLLAPRYATVAEAWTNAAAAHDAAPEDGATVQLAVSAVEELARIVNGTPRKTLGKIVSDLRSSGRVSGTAFKGLEELWAWTSNEVRHGVDSSDPPEARYAFRLCEASLHLLLDVDVP